MLVPLVSILLLFVLPRFASTTVINVGGGQLSYSESWGYVNVRPDAYMFWWLYYVNANTDPNRPLILWLQGGPGGSGCGYGNFQEIGPLDLEGNPRNTTWLLKGDLIFVDNPVGTGFSYVTKDSAFTVNIDQISADLLTWATVFFNGNPQLQQRPFYIMSESYGGKMTAAFANVLYPNNSRRNQARNINLTSLESEKKAMKSGKVKCNLKGVGLGDSWIAPIDFVKSWGPYLYHFSYLNEEERKRYERKAEECERLAHLDHWPESTHCWGEAEDLVSKLTDSVSFYNVLKRSGTDDWSMMNEFETDDDRFAYRHLDRFVALSLKDFMNGPIKTKLGVIPSFVNWGGQSGSVFKKQKTDFMRPVINIVDNLIANTTLKVVVYNGQLDLICDTIGVEMWLNKLKWDGKEGFRRSEKTSFHAGPPPATYYQTAGFYQNYKNFYFFWIMRAGHMVPADAPYATRRMMDIIMS